MKRGWIGFALLLLLLAGGVLSSWCMVQWHMPLEGLLEQASQQAQAGNWQQAQGVSDEAQRHWENRWHISAAFADHGPMEEIDSLFAQLEVYEDSRDSLGYSALCRELAREVGALGEAHIPSWWNLL